MFELERRERLVPTCLEVGDGVVARREKLTEQPAGHARLAR